MRMYRLKVWTGPSAAIELGRRARRAGLKVPTTGTEHIYVDVKGADCAAAQHNMRATLMRKYKKDFGLRAVSCAARRKK
jgi:hypothetical protein